MKYLFTLFILLLAGCASNFGQPFSPSLIQEAKPNKSQLVIYRPYKYTGPGGPALRINGEKKCMVGGNSVLVVDVSPGQINLSAQYSMSSPTVISFHADKNKTYYVRIQENPNKTTGLGSFGLLGSAVQTGLNHGNDDTIIDVIDEQFARPAIAKMRYIECI